MIIKDIREVKILIFDFVYNHYLILFTLIYKLKQDKKKRNIKKKKIKNFLENFIYDVLLIILT